MSLARLVLTCAFGVGLAGPSLADCDAVLATGHAFDAYSEVADKLRAGDAPLSIESIGCFLPGDLDGVDAKTAYQFLIGTSFHPNVLYDYLQLEIPKVFEKAARKSLAGGSALFAWRGGYLAEAMITAYEQSSDTRFLDLFVTYFDEVLALRDSERGLTDAYHGRVMHSWSERRSTWAWIGPLFLEVYPRVAHVTHAGRITLAPARFVNLVMNDPALADYRETAERYLEASTAALAEFDGDRFVVEGSDNHWYRRPITGDAEPTNHIHTVASSYLYLAETTDDPDMKQRVNEIIAVFLEGVKTAEDGTVHWKYSPYFSDLGSANDRAYSEPIRKASQTVPLLYRAYAAGYPIVDEELIAAIARTFLAHVVTGTDVLRNLSPVESGFVKPTSKHLSNLEGIVTWLEFSAYAPEIADRIRTLVGARPDLFSQGWFGSPNMARGYAYFLSAAVAETRMTTSQLPASDARR